MADFVENEPKCVMLMFPHHPPRLAQLSGVFVVRSTKNSQSVSTHEPMSKCWLMKLVLLIDAFVIFKIRTLPLKKTIFVKPKNVEKIFL